MPSKMTCASVSMRAYSASGMVPSALRLKDESVSNSPIPSSCPSSASIFATSGWRVMPMGENCHAN